MRVLKATVDNNQVRAIITDEDVKQFINTLYEKKKGRLALEIDAYIKKS